MVRTEGTSAGAGFYTMRKAKSSQVRTSEAEQPQQPAPLTMERLHEMNERFTVDALFGDDAVRLAFRGNNDGPYIGYLASGHLARYGSNGVECITLSNSVGTLGALLEYEDGWTGGDALERWLKDVAAALPQS